MRLRKFVAIVTMAALFFWAPSAIPARAFVTPCGVVVTWLATDTAFAAPPVVPCPAVPAHTANPWPVVGIMLGTVSVMVNAIIVGRTQCRELTQQEAWSSIFLPFVGMFFNQNNNKCHR